MMKEKSILKHTIVFILMIIVLSFLTFNLNKSEMNQINKIVISGNNYLSTDMYMTFANLQNINEQKDLTISFIQDRLRKHPYIQNADVIILDRGTVKVDLYEKKIDAILLGADAKYYISENAEILPALPFTKNINVPAITNYINIKSIRPYSSAKNDKILFSALKIITTAELVDPNLFDEISSVNLNNGQKITIEIMDQKFSIYFGKNEEVKKTVYLASVLNLLRSNELSKYLKYVDLSFNDLVYLGFDKVSTLDKEKT